MLIALKQMNDPVELNFCRLAMRVAIEVSTIRIRTSGRSMLLSRIRFSDYYRDYGNYVTLYSGQLMRDNQVT